MLRDNRPQSHNRRTKNAFTLIELLTVTAIIGVLASILFPVFAQVREKGRQTVCTSNLRQIALANQMYAQDYDAHFVPAAPGFPSDNFRWFGVRDAQAVFQPKAGPLVPYLKENGMLRQCPAFAAKSGFDRGTGGYVYNAYSVGGCIWWKGYTNEGFNCSAMESGLAKPAETAMFADGALDDGSGTGPVETAFMEPPPSISLHYTGWGEPLDPTCHFRHHKLCNVAFADAHVRTLPMTLSAAQSPAYPAANPQANNLGWFGPTEGDTYYDPN